MASPDNSFDKLILGGLIGSALGALLAKNKDDGALVGALIGAAIAATATANENARKANQDVLIVEGGDLYRVQPDGQKEFIKHLPRSNRKWPQTITLK